jgi:nucleotide-binding universal stress UspA family protein
MFKTILVASDGSETADRLVTVAQSLARESSSRLVVAHVVELVTGRGGPMPVRVDEERLQLKAKLQVADLKAAGYDAELTMRATRRRADRSIAEMAKDCGADLIVTGASHHGRLGDLLFGSIGQRMSRLAPCPVLVVPSPN